MLTSKDFYPEHEKVTNAFSNSPVLSESALSKRGKIYQEMNTRRSDAYTQSKHIFLPAFDERRVRYETVRKGSFLCKGVRRKRHPQLFLATKEIQGFAMHIFGPLPQTKNENTFFSVIRNRFSEMTRTVNTSKVKVTLLTNVFPDYHIAQYRLLQRLLRGVGPQFVRRFPAPVFISVAWTEASGSNFVLF